MFFFCHFPPQHAIDPGHMMLFSLAELAVVVADLFYIILCFDTFIHVQKFSTSSSVSHGNTASVKERLLRSVVIV